LLFVVFVGTALSNLARPYFKNDWKIISIQYKRKSCKFLEERKKLSLTSNFYVPVVFHFISM